ncbi:MAG: copper amine oxidase N-terminal domain-containing protein [Mycobacterium leprae]
MTAPSIPHYEVSGYVLLYDNPQKLEELIGTDVVVTGEVVVAPSVFMRKAIRVRTISIATPETSAPTEPPEVIPAPPVVPPPSVVTPPSPDPPSLPPAEPVVQLPVLPTPPESDPPVAIQPLPTPYYGTTRYLLLGRLEKTNGHFTITTVNGQTYWVVSKRLALTDLLGELIAAVAVRQVQPDGTACYAVETAVVLTKDLADFVRSNPEGLFRLPSRPIAIRVGGRLINLDPPAVMANDRTLVGLRVLAESVGAQVRWEQETRSATISLNGRTVTVQVGVNTLLLHQEGRPDEQITMDVVPVIISGRIMLPLRSLMEGLGLTVEWQEASQTIDIRL